MKIRAVVDPDQEKLVRKDYWKLPAWLQWRITNPFEELSKRYSNQDLDVGVLFQNEQNKIEEDVDILVLPRIVIKPEQQETAKRWFDDIKARGTKLVYETDDDIFSESYVGHAAQQFSNGDVKGFLALLDLYEERAKSAQWVLQQCDAVTVSTKELGFYVQEFTDKPVYVVSNAIDKNKFVSGLSGRPQVSKSFVSVGWAGGMRKQEDIEAMFEGWIKFKEKPTSSNVVFMVGGHTPQLIVDNMKHFGSRLAMIGWKSVKDYPAVMQVDIGCVSVCDTDFNKRKSVIKAWEYSLAGASVIGSFTLYNEEPIILLAQNSQDWCDFIEYSVGNKTFRINQKNMYRSHVDNHHLLEQQYVRWFEAYKDILNADKKVAV